MTGANIELLKCGDVESKPGPKTGSGKSTKARQQYQKQYQRQKREEKEEVTVQSLMVKYFTFHRNA